MGACRDLECVSLAVLYEHHLVPTHLNDAGLGLVVLEGLYRSNSAPRPPKILHDLLDARDLEVRLGVASGSSLPRLRHEALHKTKESADGHRVCNRSASPN